MNRVSIQEARRRLSAIVAAAEKGESTVITRRGRPVAQVNQATWGKGRRLPDLTEFRASIRVRGKPLSHAVIEQRRKARY